MRNLTSITEILQLIQKLWEKRPDLHFFQFISWLEHEYSRQNRDYGEKLILVEDHNLFVKATQINLFYLEDNNFLDWLKKEVQR